MRTYLIPEGLNWVKRPLLYVIIMSKSFGVNPHSIVCLNVKQLFAQNRNNIWSLSDSSGIWTPNHLVRKRTLNHLAKKYQSWKKRKTTTELRCRSQFLPLMAHGKIDDRRIKYTQKQKNMKKYYCSDLFSFAKMLKMPIYYVIYMYAKLSHAFLESFMISLSSFLSSILAQFFMTVKKLRLNFLTFLSFLNLRNSGIITLVKKVKFKLHLNIDCKFIDN